MAKFQWTAASETLGQPPALLTNLLVDDGQSLSDWQIVARAGALGGQAIKLVSTASLRRRLMIPGATASPDTRVDVRGRAYNPSTSVTMIHLASIFTKGTGAANIYCFYALLGTYGAFQINKYAPAFSIVSQLDGGIAAGDCPGWWNYRLTYQPSGSPRLRFAFWRDAGSDASPDYVITTDTVDAAVDGTAIGFGGFSSTNSLLDWITVGTGADDADIAPAAGAITLQGAASASVATSGDLTTSAPTPIDLAGGASVLVTAAADLTTTAAQVKGVSLTLYNGASPQASISGITALWWDTPTPSAFAAPVVSTTSASTDASGVLTFSINAATALSIGQTGFLMLYKAGAAATDDLIFAGRLAVTDIS